MPKTLKAVGEDKNMTLDEVRAFVKAAHKLGVPGDNPLTVEVSTSGKIKQIEVELDED
ncbi:hypothetical protein ACN20G_37125 (plasmid) [Streptomyces sp. BI20]|uniref:hypothetical protein n=1 Tax=Streptomyces sp. BI20 TaxID=3403460 RepID=UPI003C75D45D